MRTGHGASASVGSEIATASILFRWTKSVSRQSFAGGAAAGEVIGAGSNGTLFSAWPSGAQGYKKIVEKRRRLE